MRLMRDYAQLFDGTEAMCMQHFHALMRALMLVMRTTPHIVTQI